MAGTATVARSAPRSYRPDIDGLRAFAVVPVVMYHANLGIPGGFVGVDIFFVISGFLITRIIHDEMVEGQFRYADFYERRLRRLLPAAFFVFALTTAYAVTAMAAFDLAGYGRSLAAASIYLANFNFYWDTGYFLDDATTMPLLHMWSLAVEEQFYIVVPILLSLLLAFAPRRWVLPLLAAATLGGFVLCVVLTEVRQMAAYFLLPGRAWELGVGGVLALVGTGWVRTRSVAEAITLAGFALLFVSMAIIDESSAFPGWIAALPVLGSAALLAAGHFPGTLANRILTAKAPIFIGKISYSLYLVHWPIIVAIGYGGEKIGGIAGWAAFAASVLLAWLSFHLIETPVRNRKYLASRSALFGFSLLGTVLFFAVGATLYLSRGLPQRFADHEERAVLTNVDLWSETLPECVNLEEGDIARGRFCVRGRKGVAPDFALIGDSHAQALAPGLFAAADRLGIAGVQFTSSGYMPLPGRTPKGQDYEPNLDPELFAWLDRNPQIRTIYLGGYWLYEATGTTYRHEGVVHVDADYDGSGTAYNPVSFRTGLKQLFARFPNRRFVLLDDIPTGRGLNAKHYVRGLSGRGTAESWISRAEAERQRASYAPLFAELAVENANVAYEPVVFAAHCEADRCPLFGPDGKQRFIDGDHITYQRALELEPAFHAMLRRQITR